MVFTECKLKFSPLFYQFIKQTDSDQAPLDATPGLCLSKQCRPWWNDPSLGISYVSSVITKPPVMGFHSKGCKRMSLVAYEYLRNKFNIWTLTWLKSTSAVYGLQPHLAYSLHFYNGCTLRCVLYPSAQVLRFTLGFGAQLIGPIQLHVKRQNSSICKFSQDIAWTFFCLWVARSVIYLSKKWKDNLPW